MFKGIIINKFLTLIFIDVKAKENKATEIEVPFTYLILYKLLDNPRVCTHSDFQKSEEIYPTESLKISMKEDLCNYITCLYNHCVDSRRGIVKPDHSTTQQTKKMSLYFTMNVTSADVFA